MNMSVPQSLVMGFVSGLAEMLPISADAHRLILRTVFGISTEDVLFRLICHIAVLLILLWEFQPDLRHLSRTSRMMRIPPRKRRRPLDPAAAGTVRLMKSALIALLVTRLLVWGLDFIRFRPAYMSVMLAVNGLILLIPALVPGGDMDSRNMPRVMGALFGVLSGLGGIPGLSSVGVMLSGAMALAVARSYALRFAFILLIPNMILNLLSDAVHLAIEGVPTVTPEAVIVIGAGAAMAAAAAALGIRLMRQTAEHRGFDQFAYYCWGAALLCGILFLIV